MKIAIVTEISTAHRNQDVYNALCEATKDMGHEIINIGMHGPDDSPLNYLTNGFLTGLLLNLGRVDFVVGGCGTGTGYINAELCFPGVFSTQCLEPLDAWLFPQINDVNSISLALNKDYGWAAEQRLVMMFKELFRPELKAAGYPRERKEVQNALRDRLCDYSAATHRTMAECTRALDQSIVHQALRHPGVWELVDIDHVEDADLKAALIDGYNWEEK